MTGLLRILGLSVVAVSVAACGGDDQRDVGDTPGQGVDVSRFLGTTKSPPDEFAVATTKPLQLPKNFTSLPAPTPGVRSPLEADPIADARAALLGEPEPEATATTVSASEAALLSAAGSQTTDPSIRGVLDAEQAALEDARPSYALENVFPSIRRDANAGAILSPTEERARLSETLPTREIGNTTVATIPAATAPAVPTPTAPVLPTTDPTADSGLIFIPE